MLIQRNRDRMLGVSGVDISSWLVLIVFGMGSVSCGVARPAGALGEPSVDYDAVAGLRGSARAGGGNRVWASVPSSKAARKQDDAPQGALQISLASRQLDEALWAPIDEPTSFGVAYVQENPGSLGFELGLSLGRDTGTAFLPIGDNVSLDLQMLELSAGVRKTFLEGESIRPFLGAGVALVDVDYELSFSSFPGSASFDDRSFGVYAHAGLLVPLNEQVRMGIDARFVRGTDGDIGGVSGDVDYDQIGFIMEFLF